MLLRVGRSEKIYTDYVVSFISDAVQEATPGRADVGKAVKDRHNRPRVQVLTSRFRRRRNCDAGEWLRPEQVRVRCRLDASLATSLIAGGDSSQTCDCEQHDTCQPVLFRSGGLWNINLAFDPSPQTTTKHRLR